MKVGILALGIGNVRAFGNVLDRIDHPYFEIKNVSDIQKADKIIFPGVGNFSGVMSRLNTSGLRDALEKEVIVAGKPILGVCVGMQIFCSRSEEGGGEGLAWIDANVIKFNDLGQSGSLRVPHMGWNEVHAPEKMKIFRGITDPYFYFLHSYYVKVKEKQVEVCNSFYSLNFVSAFRKNNIWGVQFHPEKSHQAGQLLISNFLEV